MQINLFGDTDSNLTDKYSYKVSAPQYKPTNSKPELSELYNSSVYANFIKQIDKSNVSDEEKKFLKLAATRHLVFNYDRIADYYAHSELEMQNLMEKLALVIIDFDDAIANGYIKLSKTVTDILEKSYEK